MRLGRGGNDGLKKLSFPRNYVCQGYRKIDVTFGRLRMELPKQAYTVEFNELAVKRVKSVQSVSAVVKDSGLSDQTLRNWMTAAEGMLNSAGSTDEPQRKLLG